jgi:spermidine/putrescine transport system ATP-binding protein
MPERPPIATLRGVSKRFGEDLAVDHLDLEIAAGEFFSILGPSGCGKTTTLRMLGGFLVPDEGEIVLDGRDVTDVPPYKRNVNTVFQSYALFAHLSVADNVAFGLRRRKVAKAEIGRRVGEMLELVQLADRAQAKPAELSGGQQQRVALARALVNMPELLLLDEPLGALDLKLRREMQVELKQIQREVGITFVYVTHDQEEALTMSDRIAVMNDGVLQQCGAPRDVYDDPANGFVASFIGTSNLLEGQIGEGGVRLAGGTTLPLDLVRRNGTVLAPGDHVVVSVRPEKLILGPTSEQSHVALRAEVIDAIYLGSATHVTLNAGGVRLVAIAPHAGGHDAPAWRPGETIEVAWQAEDSLILSRPTASGEEGRP